MMVNPHAQNFPMGSGFGYSPSPAHFQQQYAQGSATMPNQGLLNNPWTFNEGLCAVLHAHGTCPQCDTLATHLSFSLISDDKTYKDAFAQRIDFIRRTMPIDDKAEESKLTLHERIGELNAQRTLERQDHECLLEDYNQVHDNLEQVRTERNQAEKDRDNYIASVEALQGDVERLQERVRELEAQSPEYESSTLGRKHKRMGDAPLNEAIPETPTSPPVSYKGLDNDMYDFNDDSVEVVTQPVIPSGTTLEQIERIPCEPEDLEGGGYRQRDGLVLYGQDANDARHNESLNLPVPLGSYDHIRVKKPEDITSVLHFISVWRHLRAYDDKGSFVNPPWAKWTTCKRLHSKALSKRVEERSSLDRTVIANWYTPRFVLHKRDTDALSQNPVAGPSSSMTRGPQQKHKGKQPMRLATTTAPTVPTTSSAPHAAQRVLRLSSPARKDPPDVWARYLCRYPHMRIAGVCRVNTDVSLRCLRGRHLVVIHEPSVEHSQTTLMRNKWATLSAELFATPGLYLSTLSSTGTSVSATVEPAPYNGTLNNTTIIEVAQFYASRGITTAVANDTALYAALWLKTFSTHDSETNIAISEAQQCVAIVLNKSEIPV